jgi:hypothetical protein
MFNRDINYIERNWLIAAVVLILAIPILVVIYSIAIILTTEKIELVKEKYEYVVEILKTAGLFIGGIAVFINAFFGAKRAYAMEETAKAANEKQITESFAKAIEQLASKKIEIRLGAIYTLERIAKYSKKDQWTIMEVLTAFVRENAPVKKEEKSQNKKSFIDDFLNTQNKKETDELPKLRLDIKACLTIIGERKYPDPLYNRKLDLSNINISEANLKKANLSRAYLKKANLSRANLLEADLTGANLIGANLTGAYLKEADLTEADLKKANLSRAYLSKAYLIGANLIGANLTGANLTGANLVEADLAEAILEDVNFKGAIMPDGSIHD